MTKATAVNCPMCGKTISRKADLARHMKIHAANKEELMHACPHEGCTYRTLQWSNLLTHMNVHSGERPNECPEPECGFKTPDPGSLTRHRKEIHGYEPKRRSRDNGTAAARKATRQRRRVAPYGIPPSSSGSGHSAPSTSTTHSPHIQLPRLLDVFPPILPSAEATCAPKEGKKNDLPAHTTKLIPKHAKNGSSAKHARKPAAPRGRTSWSAATVATLTEDGPPSPEAATSHVATSQLPTTSPTLTVEGPSVAPEQPASKGPVFEVINELAYFLSELPSSDALRTPFSLYAPSPAFYGNQYSVESLPPPPPPLTDDYRDARWPSNGSYTPQYSFGAPDMGIYQQTLVDQAPFCIAPSATVYAPMQNIYPC